MLSPGNVPTEVEAFPGVFFDAVALPKAVHHDVSCLRTANSEYIWKNAVAFLPNTLRAGTRTLCSFQGAVALFSRVEEKPEMYRLKPEVPNHWDLRPVACGGLKPFSVNTVLLIEEYS
jgi:hypothetical protein